MGSLLLLKRQSESGESRFSGRHLIRLISSFLIFSFFVQELSYANPDPQAIAALWPAPVLKFQIPKSVARVEDSYEAEGGSRKAEGTIYLIADAHTNESAQLNIARTIDLISQKDPVRYVFLEAGTGNDSLSFLREGTSLEKRTQVAKSYLKKGWIQGPDYLDLTSDHTFTLWGVEDKALYFKGLDRYRFLKEKRSEVNFYLDKVSRTTRTLKAKIYNPSLQELDEIREKFLKEEISLTDYIEKLNKGSEYQGIKVSEFYPHLKVLKDLKHLESKINFPKANEEQVRAIASLPEENQKALLALASRRNTPYKLDAAEHSAERGFYAVLESVIPKSNFPNLSQYFNYLKIANQLNAKKVLDEKDDLELLLYAAMARTMDERRLIQVSKAQETLRKVLNLKATTAEYQEIVKDPKRFDIVEISGFLNKKIMDLGSHYEEALFLEKTYDQTFTRAKEFYELSFQRDERFVENMLEKIGQGSRVEGEGKDTHSPLTLHPSPDRAAILVTGGFHTEHLKQLLKAKRISYISLTPQILQETNQAKYEKILLSQVKGSPVNTVILSHAKRDEGSHHDDAILRLPKSRQAQNDDLMSVLPGAELVQFQPTGARLSVLEDLTRELEAQTTVRPLVAPEDHEVPLVLMMDALRRIQVNNFNTIISSQAFAYFTRLELDGSKLTDEFIKEVQQFIVNPAEPPPPAARLATESAETNPGFTGGEEQHSLRYPKQLVDVLQKNNGALDRPIVIADIGMAAGNITIWTANENHSFRLIGIERNHASVATAIKNALVNGLTVLETGQVTDIPATLRSSQPRSIAFKVCDVTKGISLPNSSVDALIVHRVRDEMPDPVQRADLLKECARVLKPNGWISLVEDLYVEPSDPEGGWYERRYHVSEKIARQFSWELIQEHNLPPSFMQIFDDANYRVMVSLRDGHGGKPNEANYVDREADLIKRINEGELIIRGIGLHESRRHVIDSFLKAGFSLQNQWDILMPQDGDRRGHSNVMKGFLFRKESAPRLATGSFLAGETPDLDETKMHEVLRLARNRPGILPLLKVASIVYSQGQDGRILGEGTNVLGRPHAEPAAILDVFQHVLDERQVSLPDAGFIQQVIEYLRLRLILSVGDITSADIELFAWIHEKLGKPLESAEIFISLDPCWNCGSLLAKLRIQRVVYAMVDRNPRVGGKGHNTLEFHKINVRAGLLDKEFRRLNWPFLFSVHYLQPIYLIFHDLRKYAYSAYYHFRFQKRMEALGNSLQDNSDIKAILSPAPAARLANSDPDHNHDRFARYFLIGGLLGGVIGIVAELFMISPPDVLASSGLMSMEKGIITTSFACLGAFFGVLRSTKSDGPGKDKGGARLATDIVLLRNDVLVFRDLVGRVMLALRKLQKRNPRALTVLAIDKADGARLTVNLNPHRLIRKVLVLEDTPDTVDLYKDILKSAGILEGGVTVDYFQDAKSALNFLKGPVGQEIGLILSDRELGKKKMRGEAFAHHVRRKLKIDIPILFVSNDVSNDQFKKLLADLGNADQVMKAEAMNVADTNNIGAIVSELIERSRGARLALNGSPHSIVASAFLFGALLIFSPFCGGCVWHVSSPAEKQSPTVDRLANDRAQFIDNWRREILEVRKVFARGGIEKKDQRLKEAIEELQRAPLEESLQELRRQVLDILEGLRYDPFEEALSLIEEWPNAALYEKELVESIKNSVLAAKGAWDKGRISLREVLINEARRNLAVAERMSFHAEMTSVTLVVKRDSGLREILRRLDKVEEASELRERLEAVQLFLMADNPAEAKKAAIDDLVETAQAYLAEAENVRRLFKSAQRTLDWLAGDPFEDAVNRLESLRRGARLAQGISTEQRQGFKVTRLTDLSGDWVEVASALGGNIVGLQLKGVDVLYHDPDLTKSGGNPFMFPWANRQEPLITKGDATVDLENSNVASKDAHGLPIHGFARKLVWDVRTLGDSDGKYLELNLDSMNDPTGEIEKYFGKLEVIRKLRLKNGKLSITTEVTNHDDYAITFSFGDHPWVNLPERGDWQVRLGADLHWLTDANLLPLKQVPQPIQPGSPLDLRRFTSMNDMNLDTVLTGLHRDQDNMAAITFYNHMGGVFIEVSADSSYPHAVLWTPPGSDYAGAEFQSSSTNVLGMYKAGISEATPVTIQPGEKRTGHLEISVNKLPGSFVPVNSTERTRQAVQILNNVVYGSGKNILKGKIISRLRRGGADGWVQMQIKPNDIDLKNVITIGKRKGSSKTERDFTVDREIIQWIDETDQALLFELDGVLYLADNTGNVSLFEDGAGARLAADDDPSKPDADAKPFYFEVQDPDIRNFTMPLLPAAVERFRANAETKPGDLVGRILNHPKSLEVFIKNGDQFFQVLEVLLDEKARFTAEQLRLIEHQALAVLPSFSNIENLKSYGKSEGELKRKEEWDFWWYFLVRLFILENRLRISRFPIPDKQARQKVVHRLYRPIIQILEQGRVQGWLRLSPQLIFTNRIIELGRIVELKNSALCGLAGRFLSEWRNVTDFIHHATPLPAEDGPLPPSTDAREMVKSEIARRRVETQLQILTQRMLPRTSTELLEWNQPIVGLQESLEGRPPVFFRSEATVRYDYPKEEIPNAWKFQLDWLRAMGRSGYTEWAIQDPYPYLHAVWTWQDAQGENCDISKLVEDLDAYLNRDTPGNFLRDMGLSAGNVPLSVQAAADFFEQLRQIRHRNHAHIDIFYNDLESVKNWIKKNKNKPSILIGTASAFTDVRSLSSADPSFRSLFNGVFWISQEAAKADYHEDQFSIASAFGHAAYNVGRSYLFTSAMLRLRGRKPLVALFKEGDLKDYESPFDQYFGVPLFHNGQAQEGLVQALVFYKEDENDGDRSFSEPRRVNQRTGPLVPMGSGSGARLSRDEKDNDPGLIRDLLSSSVSLREAVSLVARRDLSDSFYQAIQYLWSRGLDVVYHPRRKEEFSSNLNREWQSFDPTRPSLKGVFSAITVAGFENWKGERTRMKAAESIATVFHQGIKPGVPLRLSTILTALFMAEDRRVHDVEPPIPHSFFYDKEDVKAAKNFLKVIVRNFEKMKEFLGEGMEFDCYGNTVTWKNDDNSLWIEANFEKRTLTAKERFFEMVQTSSGLTIHRNFLRLHEREFEGIRILNFATDRKNSILWAVIASPTTKELGSVARLMKLAGTSQSGIRFINRKELKRLKAERGSSISVLFKNGALDKIFGARLALGGRRMAARKTEISKVDTLSGGETAPRMISITARYPDGKITHLRIYSNGSTKEGPPDRKLEFTQADIEGYRNLKLEAALHSRTNEMSRFRKMVLAEFGLARVDGKPEFKDAWELGLRKRILRLFGIRFREKGAKASRLSEASVRIESAVKADHGARLSFGGRLENLLAGVAQAAPTETALNGSRLAVSLREPATIFELAVGADNTMTAVAEGVGVVRLSISKKDLAASRLANGTKNPTISVQDIRAMTDAVNDRVGARLGQVELPTGARLVLQIDPRFLPKDSFDLYAARLTLVLGELGRESYGKNVLLQAVGPMGARLAEVNEQAKGLFIQGSLPPEFTGARLARMAAPSNLKSDAVNLPMAALNEGDIPAFKAAARLAIYAGKLDSPAFSQPVRDAFSTLAGEPVDTDTLNQIFTAGARLAILQRFSIKPLINAAINEAVQFFKVAARMAAQAA